jgi:hypothetical protein
MPLFVLQDRLCSVHAAGAFPGGWRRLFAVNVKLTMRLGIGAGLLMSARSMLADPSKGSARLLHRWRQTGLIVTRGGVGMSPVFPAREDQHKRGEGFLRAFPFFFGVLLLATIPDLALQHQAA